MGIDKVVVSYTSRKKGTNVVRACESSQNVVPLAKGREVDSKSHRRMKFMNQRRTEIWRTDSGRTKTTRGNDYVKEAMGSCDS